jgi:hypothetical protein
MADQISPIRYRWPWIWLVGAHRRLEKMTLVPFHWLLLSFELETPSGLKLLCHSHWWAWSLKASMRTKKKGGEGSCSQRGGRGLGLEARASRRQRARAAAPPQIRRMDESAGVDTRERKATDLSPESVGWFQAFPLKKALIPNVSFMYFEILEIVNIKLCVYLPMLHVYKVVSWKTYCLSCGLRKKDKIRC